MVRLRRQTRPLCLAAALLVPVAANRADADVLDDALTAIDVEREEIVTPRALERDYNLACRLPLIDALMAEPLRLPSFWRRFADDLTATAGSASDAYRLALATLDDGVTHEMSLPAASPTRSRAAVTAQVAHLFPEIDESKIDAAWRSDPRAPEVYELVGRLAHLLAAVAEERAAAFANVDMNRLATLGADRLGYFFEDDEYSFLTVSVERMADLNRIADELRRVDFASLFTAGGWLVQEGEAIVALEVDAPDGAGAPPPGPLFDLETPAGRLIIGGWGDDVWSEPAAVLVDLGGDDRYGEGVGAARSTDAGFALVVDREGDDLYESRERPGQGNGTLGVAVHVDGAGNDRYWAGAQAQGSAFGGVGVLVDLGGDDIYGGTTLVQGAAAFGVGLLLDRAGADRYAADGLAQGFGSALGLGLLHDSRGDDRRECGSWNTGERQLRLGNCQGGAVGVRPYPWKRDPAHYGGLGFLVDDAGNDTYDAKIHSQGGSYFLGLGALFERAGDDRYAGHREHHQGGSMHLAAAILTDLAGDDHYYGYDSSQGAGNDRSVGILLDHAGDDSYQSPFGNSQAYSRKANSLSLLVDHRGADRYRCRTEGDERCQAYAQLTSTPHDQSVVIFLDLAGEDAYDQPGRGDGLTWQLQPLVIGRDLAAAGAPRFDPFTPRTRSARFAPFAQFSRIASDAPPAATESFAAWVRRHLDAARTRPDDGFVHHPIEAVTLMAARGALGPKHLAALASWLGHPRAEVRGQVAKILGRSDEPALGTSLLRGLGAERDAGVRRFLIEALGRLGADEAGAALADRVARDPSAACRRQALDALREIGGEAAPQVLLGALADASPGIRFQAAKSLARLGDPAHNERLFELVDDPDPWVRRAVAHALMAGGDERGIPVMFETMDFYSLDNSYYAWGRDIGKLLEKYTNVTFTRLDETGAERRDDLNRERWRAWWAKNAATFAIDPLLPAARLLDEGDRLRSDKQEDAARERYRDALTRVPGYALAEERLAAE